MTATPNVQSYVGNLTVLYLDGKAWAMTQSVRIVTDYGQQANSGVGDNEVIEYVPGMTQITFEVSGAMSRSASLQSEGLSPATTEDILLGNTFHAKIYDKYSRGVIKTVLGLSVSQDTITIAKHAINQFDATFMALRSMGSNLSKLVGAPSVGAPTAVDAKYV